tara:strand:- start:28 stop:438 length:411 start_codon:yes stop_codon:yes gene_type:complete
MDTLDIYLQNKIYNYYWQRRFCTDVIQHLQKIKIYIHQFTLFIDKHILHNTSIKHYKYYLKKYNNLLETICYDKGMLLYLRNDWPFLYSLKRNIEYEKYKIVAPNYYFVLKYTLSKSGAMRYHIMEKFRNIEHNSF